MDYKHIIFSGHAIRQMFHRGIGNEGVLEVIRSGEVIKEYREDKPYPSFLILGLADKRPIHVVFALDEENQVGIVVTVYVPDSQLWNRDFKTRRNKP